MRSLTVWHGTTRSAAERIAQEGFKRVDTARVLEDVAHEHEVSVENLREVLKAAGRFVAVQDGRNDAVWFAASKDNAMRWAQRAPEVRWEALWGIWWLTHGGLEADWSPWADPVASAWHARQFFADPPAIVKVRVPADRFRNLSAEKAVKRVQRGTPELSVAHPVPAEWVAGYEIIPREIGFTAAAGILGLTVEELGRRVDAEEMISCRAPRKLLDEWYWHLDELCS